MSQRNTSAVLQALLAISFVLSIFFIFFRFFASSAGVERIIFSQLPNNEYSLSFDDRISLSNPVRVYLNQGVPLPTELFSEQEIVHMHDVRQLFVLEGWFLFISLCTLVAIIGSHRVSHREIVESCMRGSRAAVILGAAVGLSSVAWFETFFTTAHRLLFANDFWLLDPSVHLLIRIYPPEFFSLFLAYVGLSLLIIFGAVWFLSALFLRKRSVF